MSADSQLIFLPCPEIVRKESCGHILSLKVRLSDDDPRTEWGRKLQVILNDVARIIVKKRQSDHVRVEDLLKKP